ncbi:hypothetical protein AB6A40_005183 [Gnathostoma spinigerum]|uniref:Myb-like domain-containing protein n=1 Tax=Gnathostoma spinigerum TaxID=75299 RepID=A0ABD6EJZ8_9BILA
MCLEFPDGPCMPTWTPPSPPLSDSENDLYTDTSADFWYEIEPMSEARLPSVIHELRRPRPASPPKPVTTPPVAPLPSNSISLFENSSIQPSEVNALSNEMHPDLNIINHVLDSNSRSTYGSTNSIVVNPTISIMLPERERVNTTPLTGASTGAPYLDTSSLLRPLTPNRVSNSVDDAIDSVRKSTVLSNSVPINRFSTSARHCSARSIDSGNRTSKNDIRSFSPPPPENEALDYEGPEWSTIEDHALLMAIIFEQRMSNNLRSAKAGHVVSWDFVSRYLSRFSHIYRSPRQCSLHYQMIVRPREEGRLMALDPITKKLRKVPISNAELFHVKRGRTTTDQQYASEAKQLLTERVIQMKEAINNVKRKLSVSESRRLDAPQVTFANLSSAEVEKVAEYGSRFIVTVLPIELVGSRDERRSKVSEQDKEVRKMKDLSERHKVMANNESYAERDRLIQERESAIMSLPGVIHYERVTFFDSIEEARKMSDEMKGPPEVLPIAGVRPIGPIPASAVIAGHGAGAMAEATQTHTNQRTVPDHPSLTSVSTLSSALHTGSTRRVSISSNAQSQHPQHIVMTSGVQVNSPVGQQPYTVVVSSQESVASTGAQQLGGRIQYTSRQDGERQTVYRAIAPTGSKRPGTPVQRIGQTQIYATTSHVGRQLLVSQGGDPSSVGDQPQIQMMRPHPQQLGPTIRRQDMQQKVQQRAQGRVYVTTTPSGERTYLMPHSQVRMFSSGSRIAQKRSSGNLQGKTIAGQQQVTMMMPSRGGTIQQIRAVSRNLGSNYQSSRVPPLGLVMSGSSGARSNETMGGSGTTRQLPAPGGSLVSSGSLAHTRQVLTSASPSALTRQLTTSNSQSSSSGGSGNSQSQTVMRNIAANAVSLPSQGQTCLSHRAKHYGSVSSQSQSLPSITLSQHSQQAARSSLSNSRPSAVNTTPNTSPTSHQTSSISSTISNISNRSHAATSPIPGGEGALTPSSEATFGSSPAQPPSSSS